MRETGGKDSEPTKGQNMLKYLSATTGRTLVWVVAGLTIILLAALWLFADRIPWESKSLDLKKSKIVFRKKIAPDSILGHNVIRKKIPPDSKLAQNVIRKKIAVAKTPFKQPTETRMIQPEENKAAIKPPPEIETKLPEEIKAAVKPPAETEAKQPAEIEAVLKPPTETKAKQPAEIEAALNPPAETRANQPAEIEAALNPPKVKMKPPVTDKTVPPEPAIATSTQAKPEQITELNPSVALTQQSRPQAAGQKIDKRAIRRERWILNQDSQFYTIQIIGVHKEQSLSEFVQKYQLLEQNEIAYYETTFKGKVWYQLLYGVYPTKKGAELAAGKLPEDIGKAGPWIRRIAKVQKVIRSKAVP